MSAPIRPHDSSRIRTETRRRTHVVSRLSPRSPFAQWQADDSAGRVLPFTASKALAFYHPALKPSTKADLFRDAAIAPHTQWSSRKAAILKLHELCSRTIDQHRRLARLTPEAGYADRAVRRFVAKLKRLKERPGHLRGAARQPGCVLGRLPGGVREGLRADVRRRTDPTASRRAGRAEGGRMNATPRLAVTQDRTDLRDLRQAIGQLVARAFVLMGITKKEATYRLQYSNAGTISRWCSGTERPQFDKLFTIDGFELAFVQAIAEGNPAIVVDTVITLGRARKEAA
jgi:hypothetical protein